MQLFWLEHDEPQMFLNGHHELELPLLYYSGTQNAQ